MAKAVLVLILVALVVAQDPIVQLSGMCPPLSTSAPSLQLTADVPAYAMAKCRNGDKQLTASDQVNYYLDGSFDQAYTGPSCLFYKKAGSNTYTVDVEVGWGEPSAQVVERSKVKTISCAYDDHGRAVSTSQTITSWFLNPREQQHLLGENATAELALELWDVLDRRITADHIQIGRKIRLVAFNTSGPVPGLRALSCSARNSVSQYSIVRAGCGDGLVFHKTDGFETRANYVFSPYFDTFRLAGSDNTVEFECVFTLCTAQCEGNSCPVEVGFRKHRRSAAGPASTHGPFVIARSGPVNLR